MKTPIEATEMRIRHLEQIRAACVATISAEKELLRIQRANGRPAEALRAQQRRNGGGARRAPAVTPLSSRKQIVKLLEDHYPTHFDPQEVARKASIVKRSPDGRLSTYSLLARLYQEGKIDKQGPGRYRALPPAKRAKAH